MEQIKSIDPEVARELFGGDLDRMVASPDFTLMTDEDQEEVFSYEDGVLTVNAQAYNEQVGNDNFYQKLVDTVRQAREGPQPKTR